MRAGWEAKVSGQGSGAKVASLRVWDEGARTQTLRLQAAMRLGRWRAQSTLWQPKASRGL